MKIICPHCQQLNGSYLPSDDDGGFYVSRCERCDRIYHYNRVGESRKERPVPSLTVSVPVTQAEIDSIKQSRARFTGVATNFVGLRSLNYIDALLRAIAERDATIDKLKASRDAMDRCLQYWQARFVVLSDAWRSGNNDAILSACMAFVKANDDAPANAKLQETAELQLQLRDAREDLANYRASAEEQIGSITRSRDSMDRCLQYWQARFVVLSDAWRSGSNDAVLSACMAFLKANDDAPANAKLKDMAKLEEQLRLHKEALRWALEGNRYSDAADVFYGRGCGCCEDNVEPPANLSQTVLEAVRSAS